MSRLSVEIPDRVHQQIKAQASLNGLSLREYVLQRLGLSASPGRASADEYAGAQDTVMERTGIAEEGANWGATLTEPQQHFVDELIQAGRYRSTGEAIRAGLTLLQDMDQRKRAEIEAIRAGVKTGLQQANAGEFTNGTGEQAINRVFAQAVN